MQRRIPFAAALVLNVGASPLYSDTIATEVWAEWQAQSQLTGQTITATVAETDSGLTLTNVVTRAVEEGVETRGEIDEIRMIENADGTLSVEMSDAYRLSFIFDDTFTGATNTVTAVMTHEGLNIAVSGEADARTYTYSADLIAIGDLAIDVPDDEVPEISVDLIVRDLASTYSLTGADLETMRFSDATSIGAIALLVDLVPPEPEPGRMKVGMQILGVNSASEGSMITLGGPQVFMDGIPEGLDLQLNTSYEEFALEFAIAFPQVFSDVLTTVELTYENAGGGMDVGFSNSAMAFDARANDVSMLLNTSDLPVPVAVTASGTGMGLSVPLEAGDGPSQVAARIGYTDLTIGEAVWGLFDPSGLIPRDPANVILDASATVQLFQNILELDFDNIVAPPGELRGLDIQELRISAGGAELTGEADLSFAPGQIIPIPAGTASLALSGGNGLLDALIAAGLVPAEEAAIGRGMILGFTAEGEGPDTRETTLEFDGAGGVTSNGIPLPF